MTVAKSNGKPKAKPKAKAKAKAAPAPPTSSPITWHGSDDLRPLLVPISALSNDPANLNVHPERSIEEITASYARWGQQKVIVSDAHGVIRDGNGQLTAARGLGWTHLAVSRSGLGPADLVLYSIAANQTGKHSDLDDERVKPVLLAYRAEGIDLAGTGFNAAEVDALLGPLGNIAPPPGADGQESDEGVADEVEFHECPACHHRWPKGGRAG
jgi:hypothetical protein